MQEGVSDCVFCVVLVLVVGRDGTIRVISIMNIVSFEFVSVSIVLECRHNLYRLKYQSTPPPVLNLHLNPQTIYSPRSVVGLALLQHNIE